MQKVNPFISLLLSVFLCIYGVTAYAKAKSPSEFDTCGTTEQVIATQVSSITFANESIQKGKLTFISCDSLGFALNTSLLEFLNVSQLSFKLYSDSLFQNQIYPITADSVYSPFSMNATDTLYVEMKGPIFEFEFVNLATTSIFTKIHKPLKVKQ